MKRFLHKIKSQNLQEMIKEYLWLIRCSMQHKGKILWYLLMGILGTAMSLAGSLLSKYIIDAVTGQDTHRIVIALIFFVLMQLSQIGIRAISSRISTKISIDVNQQMIHRHRFFIQIKEPEKSHIGDITWPI